MIHKTHAPISFVSNFWGAVHNELNPNKAYIELPKPLDELAEYLENPQNAKTVTFSFGLPDEEISGVTTDIVLSNEIADEVEDAIYDLQGRKVEHPTNGVYIRDGKKFVIK